MINKALLVAWLSWASANAQSLGGAGTLRGTVRDASDAVIPGASVVLSNPLTGFSRETRTGNDGVFTINGIPPNSYRLEVAAAGFQANTVAVAIRTGIPLEVKVRVELASQQSSVVVEASADNLVENKATPSDIVDRQLLAVLPLASPGSGLNDAISTRRRGWPPIPMASFIRSAIMRR